jgi:ParB/RepB/Spo0J family partition protein
MNATATKPAKKDKSTKTAADQPPSVEIRKGTASNAVKAELVSLDQIDIVDKHDRVRDAAFDQQVRERAASMADVGLLQPILLRKRVTMKPLERPYELAAGEIRYRAAVLLGWPVIAAVFIGKDQAIEDVRAAENLQRQDLDEDMKAMTVGDMLAREIDALSKEQSGVKFEELDAPAQDAMREAALKRVAARLGWPLQRTRDYAYMAELPEEVLSLARQGRLSMSHCRVLAQLADHDMMERFARVTAAGEDPVLEPMKSLEDLKGWVRREICRLNKVPWDVNVAFGPKHSDGKQYACAKCPHNSLNRTGLFDGANLTPEGTNHFDANSNYGVTEKDLEGGICGKLECYRAKNTASKQAWRGAADRIAKKVGEAKPAERAALKKQLLKDAAERCSFVPITTFGKLATARIEQRLEAGTPQKKNKAAADHATREGNQQVRWEAENMLREAEREICDKIEEAVIASLSGPATPPWRRVLFQTLLYTNLGQDAFDYGRAKPETIKRFRLAAAAVVDPKSSASDAIDAIVGILDKKRDAGLHLDGNLKDMQVLVEVFGLKDIPPAPKLADFLPKPKAEKPAAAKKGAKAKPAKKSKTTKPAANVDDDEGEEA